MFVVGAEYCGNYFTLRHRVAHFSEHMAGDNNYGQPYMPHLMLLQDQGEASAKAWFD